MYVYLLYRFFLYIQTCPDFLSIYRNKSCIFPVLGLAKIECWSAYYITIVQIIFHFRWDHWAHCGIFENGVLLMYKLEGVSSVANFITAYEESQ